MVAGAPACSPQRGEDELFAPGGVGIPVVDAILVVGEPFPDVFLTRTLAPDEPFDRDRAGLRGAVVTITGGGIALDYEESTPGHYEPPHDFYTVMGDSTYHLTAQLPGGTTLRASTRTPTPVTVNDWVLLDSNGENVTQRLTRFSEVDPPDSVYTLPENQLVYTQGIIEIRQQDEPAVGYQVGLRSLDTGSRLLVQADFLDESDLDSFTRINASPPIIADATPIRMPWFAIYYEGRYVMRLFSMDRNWYDLARTDPVLGTGGFGFGGEAGDTATEPIFHVDGGIGLFGSMSVDSVGFYVNPLPGS